MKNIELTNKILVKIVNLEIRKITLGHGSFLTLDFGKEIKTNIFYKNEESSEKRGEWRLWVYMCCWRIDIDDEPLVGSNDSREKISLLLNKINGKKLTGFKIINNSLDVILNFENNIRLILFSCNTEEDEQWMLFTPDYHVLVIGPANAVSYELSSNEQ